MRLRTQLFTSFFSYINCIFTHKLIILLIKKKDIFSIWLFCSIYREKRKIWIQLGVYKDVIVYGLLWLYVSCNDTCVHIKNYILLFRCVIFGIMIYLFSILWFDTLYTHTQNFLQLFFLNYTIRIKMKCVI